MEVARSVLQVAHCCVDDIFSLKRFFNTPNLVYNNAAPNMLSLYSGEKQTVKLSINWLPWIRVPA